MQDGNAHAAEDDVQIDIVPITALQEIEEHKYLKLELANMENHVASIARKIERKETRTFAVKNEIYQLLGFYSVFQGVVLTAVAQASSLRCRHWWAPFTLSLIASILTFIGLYQKLHIFHEGYQDFENDRFNFTASTRDIQLFKKKGRSFNFQKDVTYGTRKAKIKSRFRRLCDLVFSLNTIVFVSLLAFSAVILTACRVILCNPPLPVGGPSN